MRLYEYEGKKLFASAGIQTPAGILAKNTAEVLAAAEKLGYPVAVKAQVLSGGRGKRGLVKLVCSEEEARAAAEDIFPKIGKDIILVEAGVNIAAEGYVGITADDVSGRPVMILSQTGGVDIEAYAKENKTIKTWIDPVEGLTDGQIEDALAQAGYTGAAKQNMAGLLKKLYGVFEQYELETAEINPVLFEAGTDAVIAGDAKAVSDDYALFRQPLIAEFRDARKDGEDIASESFAYVELDGNIGVISVGASNTMMLIDTINNMGGRAANFLDAMGANSYEEIVQNYVNVLTRFEEDDKVVACMINFTLTAQPLKNYAGAVAEAMGIVKPKKKYIACIRATGAAVYSLSLEDGKAGLRERGVTVIDALRDAVEEAVRLSKEGRQDVVTEGGI